MKLLADENFPPTLISYLQKRRHDVKRIQRSLHGVSDSTVRTKALVEKRIILSFDKDYLKSIEGEEKVSVMVLDFPNVKPEEIIPFMDEIISAINTLRRKKQPFIGCYSKNGLEVIL
ncbi:DUF5615 family PIN-like protein [Candidatus Daviesbacteria bacterium]|nr:DUF5615 family PIN-like protein [Candidatus Daviesbacteria bacterium]